MNTVNALTLSCTLLAVVLCFVLIVFVDKRFSQFSLAKRLICGCKFSACLVGAVVLFGLFIRFLK